MAERRSSGKTNLAKQQTTSIFLNPPASGFLYGDNLNQSPLLVPVSTSVPVSQTNVPAGDASSISSFQPSAPNATLQEPPFQDKTSTTDSVKIAPEQITPPSIAAYFPTHQPESNILDVASDSQKTHGRFSQFFYTPVHPHWMYCKEVEKKPVWVPFSLLDSLHLEEEYVAKSGSEDFGNVIVQTDGGRYDVHLKDQERHAVYWEENKTPVRRATWFYRPYGARFFVPYPEKFADKLEEEYCVAVTSNTWHRRLEFPEGDTVVIHNPSVIVHYQASSPHEWEGLPEDQVKPTVVKRGFDDFENIEDGEGLQIDHLVFVVHGIGAICDLRFRTLPEVVNDFRTISSSLLKSHFREHLDEGNVGRVEFLPASWHTFLHGEATGIDDKLKPITLTSIPKLRYFANDAILDVLFYTSPVYCQAIINQVCSEINRLYALFLSRNPTFHGKVSLAGHSLGSVILFDLLYHQSANLEPPLGKSTLQQLNEQHASDSLIEAASTSVELDNVNAAANIAEALKHLGLEEFIDTFNSEKMDMDALMLCKEDDLKEMKIPLGPRKKLLAHLKLMKEKSDILTDIPKNDLHSLNMNQGRRPSETTINYVVGLAGTGHPFIIYPSLDFQSTCFFALGSPIAMFLTVRGLDMHWEDFQLPTCPAFYNIFHPYDPVAYRIEPLLKPENYNYKPVMILHHKGRKRMHLEIRESLSRVGADLKQKLVESLKSTWNTINDFARAHSASTTFQNEDEIEVDRIMEEELLQRSKDEDEQQRKVSVHESKDDEEVGVGDMGKLNGGRRIDYVLQEKPIESFNEYLFALGSHTCYWESEDTVLLMLKEIYGSCGIYPSAIPNEQPPACKPPLLYNPLEAQRYYASVGISQQSSTGIPNSQTNPYRLTSIGQHHPSTQTTSFPMEIQNNSSPKQPVYGVDPTAPQTISTAGPPPLIGFVKQSPLRK